MAKQIPNKCLKCAAIEASIAKEVNQACWNPEVCYSRRYHARHHQRVNQARSLRRASNTARELEVDTQEFEGVKYAILVIYRLPGYNSVVHSIAAQVWEGSSQCAYVKPLICLGMTKAQVLGYVSKLLEVLQREYSIKKFAAIERREPE